MVKPETEREGWRRLAAARGISPEVWRETKTGRKEMVWRIQGGGSDLRTDVADPLTDEGPLSLVKPMSLKMARRWYRTFAVLPTLADKRKVRDSWTRLGWANVYQYQSGLRFSLEVWRCGASGEWLCLAPPSARGFVWMQGCALQLGAWCLELWKEAWLRCRAAALAAGCTPEQAAQALGYLKHSQSPRWYHRAWRYPRGDRWLGPNGWGDEIDSTARARKLLATRARIGCDEQGPVCGSGGEPGGQQEVDAGSEATGEGAAGSGGSEVDFEGPAARAADASLDSRDRAGVRGRIGEVDARLVQAAVGADGTDEGGRSGR